MYVGWRKCLSLTSFSLTRVCLTSVCLTNICLTNVCLTNVCLTNVCLTNTSVWQTFVWQMFFDTRPRLSMLLATILACSGVATTFFFGGGGKTLLIYWLIFCLSPRHTASLSHNHWKGHCPPNIILVEAALPPTFFGTDPQIYIFFFWGGGARAPCALRSYAPAWHKLNILFSALSLHPPSPSASLLSSAASRH